MNRLQKYYSNVICYDLLFTDHFVNVMQLPKLNRIVLNTGLGLKAVTDKKTSLTAMLGQELISGQCPIITRAKKSIDKFKLREKMPIGCKVTLRNRRMFEFFDKLIITVLPNLEDYTELYIQSLYQQKGPRILKFPFEPRPNGQNGGSGKASHFFQLGSASSFFDGGADAPSVGSSEIKGLLSIKQRRSRRLTLGAQLLSPNKNISQVLDNTNIHSSSPISSTPITISNIEKKSTMFRTPYFGPSAVDFLSILTSFPLFHFGFALKGQNESSSTTPSSSASLTPNSSTRYLSYGLGIKDFFRFKEIEYDKFETSNGLDILLILSTPKSLIISQPKYFLSCFQMPFAAS